MGYGSGRIDWLAFEEFFSGFSTPSHVGFKRVFMGALIKNMLEADIDTTFRALLSCKYHAVVDDIQRQSSRRMGSAWALLPRVSWGDIESGPMMEKSWTEPGRSRHDVLPQRWKGRFSCDKLWSSPS